MIKIELSDEVKSKHLEYFEHEILPKLDDTLHDLHFKKYKVSHQKFMEYCKDNYKILAIGKPAELRKFVEGIPKLSKRLIEKNPIFLRKDKNDTDSKIDYNKYLLEKFNYKKFSELNDYVANEIITQDNYKELSPNLIKKYWTPYTFVIMSNIRVCPYCNRQYITPIYVHSNSKMEKHKLRADLDHFYPQNKFPYLSMSIYNLVPCCKFCNSSLKHSKEFEFTDVNPYEDNFDDYFKFKVDGLTRNTPKVYIKKIRDDKINHYLDYFQIEALYKYHSNQAEELIQKRIIYSENYIDELYENNKQFFQSRDSIKETIIGYIADKKNFNNEAFSKFRRDISEQLHFIDSAPKSELIEGLKQLIRK